MRDAVLLTAAGGDSGLSGKVFLGFKALSTRKGPITSKFVAELAELLELAWEERLAAVVDYADAALQSGRAAPFAVAEVVKTICGSGRTRRCWLGHSPLR